MNTHEAAWGAVAASLWVDVREYDHGSKYALGRWIADMGSDEAFVVFIDQAARLMDVPLTEN